MKEESLRAEVRARVCSGQLPLVAKGETFGGYGSNSNCDCCGEVIARDQIEYEVLITGRAMRAHRQCYQVWWDESDTMLSMDQNRR